MVKFKDNSLYYCKSCGEYFTLEVFDLDKGLCVLCLEEIEEQEIEED